MEMEEAMNPDHGSAHGPHLLHLEQLWVEEIDLLEKEKLYKEVQAAEIAYVLEVGLYDALIAPGATSQRIAREKTRNRMRTRLKNNRAIGLPVAGVARAARIRQCHLKNRVDPITRQVIAMEVFLRRGSWSNRADALRAWRRLPRVVRMPTARVYENSLLSWTQCCRRWSWEYELAGLYAWYSTLPRAPRPKK